MLCGWDQNDWSARMPDAVRFSIDCKLITLNIWWLFPGYRTWPTTPSVDIRIEQSPPAPNDHKRGCTFCSQNGTRLAFCAYGGLVS
jgi:hypothetical protein